MAQPPYPNPGQDSREPPGRGSARTSRWQKVVGILGLLVALGVGILLFGPGLGGGHDPGGATPAGGNQEQPAGGTQVDSGESGDHTPPPWVPEDAHD